MGGPAAAAATYEAHAQAWQSMGRQGSPQWQAHAAKLREQAAALRRL